MNLRYHPRLASGLELCMGLVRVHWELVINIERESGGPLLWVEPLTVIHRNDAIVNEDISISDGRTESDAL